MRAGASVGERLDGGEVRIGGAVAARVALVAAAARRGARGDRATGDRPAGRLVRTVAAPVAPNINKAKGQRLIFLREGETLEAVGDSGEEYFTGVLGSPWALCANNPIVLFSDKVYTICELYKCIIKSLLMRYRKLSVRM